VASSLFRFRRAGRYLNQPYFINNSSLLVWPDEADASQLKRNRVVLGPSNFSLSWTPSLFLSKFAMAFVGASAGRAGD
jgi:hypothetical protein